MREPLDQMKPKMLRAKRKQRGSALVTTFILVSLLSVAAVTYVSSSTQTVVLSNRRTMEVQATSLCESGVQMVLRNLWRPFKVSQNFDSMDSLCAGASVNSPKSSLAGGFDGIGRYSAGVIGISTPGGNNFARMVTIRAVGWLDRNGNAQLDSGEYMKTVDVVAQFELTRSQIFDYTYFINNYGWMEGFRPDWLIVNGDMRANGNFEFKRNGTDNTTGSGTSNGSIIAAMNEKLVPKADGLIMFEGSTQNVAPVKWTQSSYNTNASSQAFWRQGYDPAVHGARGSATYEQWRDYIFDAEGGILNNRPYGSYLADSNGYRRWTRGSLSETPNITTFDTSPTQEVIMPDLSNLSYYTNLSQTYVNTKATYADGTPNPNFNQGAWLEIWDTTLNAGAGGYRRISTNGVVSGSAILVGTSTRPIRIHGPVTFTEDVVIKGTISGQGTIYTGRNVHIVGNIQYQNTPDFRRTGGRTTFSQIENFNEKRDFLGLAARGSVIMGNTNSFGAYPLNYMTPPFTKPRYDEQGNLIPAYDAMVQDGTRSDGSIRRRYMPTFSNAQIAAVADTGVNRVDAILYSNFVGGGNVGTAGGGFTLNGTIICRDESIVAWSVPIRMNYDHRIRERGVQKTPLIDLQLPRSPTMLRSTWQDRGFKVAP